MVKSPQYFGNTSDTLYRFYIRR